MKKGILLVIGLYQRAISPYLPVSCRFEPTCSTYSHQAIAQYGLARGIWLTVRRLARCTPLTGRDYYPVP